MSPTWAGPAQSKPLSARRYAKHKSLMCVDMLNSRDRQIQLKSFSGPVISSLSSTQLRRCGIMIWNGISCILDSSSSSQQLQTRERHACFPTVFGIHVGLFCWKGIEVRALVSRAKLLILRWVLQTEILFWVAGLILNSDLFCILTGKTLFSLGYLHGKWKNSK